MPLFDGSSRDQLRQAYADAWRKHLTGEPITALEAGIIDVIGAHPEYQALIADAEAAKGFEPAAGGVNPFLHMGLHLAVREQVAIDRPPGVLDLHRRLQARYGEPHRAEHVLMEALAETLSEAQRSHRPPDEARYLEIARRSLGSGGP
ncbi:MAG TPA: DUF1841 family protein [Steroidobacteraceae bacterium]|jgi:hypothetical protein|nr:DUF1841 family protein [Steroidobacteraceae bacterium]